MNESKGVSTGTVMFSVPSAVVPKYTRKNDVLSASVISENKDDASTNIEVVVLVVALAIVSLPS